MEQAQDKHVADNLSAANSNFELKRRLKFELKLTIGLVTFGIND